MKETLCLPVLYGGHKANHSNESERLVNENGSPTQTARRYRVKCSADNNNKSIPELLKLLLTVKTLTKTLSNAFNLFPIKK